MVRSEADGYLHSEVGIDEELERLLAEDPGLYMEDGPGQKMVWETSPPKTPLVTSPPKTPNAEDVLQIPVATRYAQKVIWGKMKYRSRQLYDDYPARCKNVLFLYD